MLAAALGALARDRAQGVGQSSLIQINFSAGKWVQSASMQSIPKRLADIRARIAEADRRLAELENGAPDHGMTAMLIDSVAATLKLLREYEARLERRLVPVKAVGNRL